MHNLKRGRKDLACRVHQWLEDAKSAVQNLGSRKLSVGTT